MTEFVQLNLTNYSHNAEKTVTLHPRLCICCLRDDITLIKLKTCQHKRILELIFKCKDENCICENATVCYHCHGMLQNIERFISQVEGSLASLINANAKKFSKSKVLILQQSCLELNYTVNSEPIQFKIKEYAAENLPTDITESQVKIEFEEEDNNSSDVSDIPLSDMKMSQDISGITVCDTIKANKRKAVKPSRNAMTPFQEKYAGKIKVVTLSMEELLLERQKEALKESYLKLPYKCEYCIMGFDHEKFLEDHNEKRHNKINGAFVCDTCNSVLNTKFAFDGHCKRHLKRYDCCECGKRYCNIRAILQHYNGNHGTITQYSCKMCDFTTESLSRYRRHCDGHRTGKVDCEQCGNTYASKQSLRVHMITIHGETSREYSCGQCGQKYRCRSSFDAHLARHSSTPAYCVECDTHFRSELGLRNHLKTHSKHVQDADKRFSCQECGSKFLKKSSLQEHIDWTHLNNIKYACSKCSKVFKSKSSLRKHKNFVHDKKRPPRNKICDHCGRGFTTKSTLQSHIRKHTGERPLQCLHCPATFAYSSALYTHNKLRHAARAT